MTQPTQSTTAVTADDGDTRYFSSGGQTDNDQVQFFGQTGIGYNGNSQFTGNSITANEHNWGKWDVTNFSGTVDVSVTIPAFTYTYQGRQVPLSRGVVYQITAADGVHSVPIDQLANAGKTVSLGTFTFNGTGSVRLNDVVAERSYEFQSVIVYDAVFFGAQPGQNLDLTPPKIFNVKSSSDDGTFYIQADVTDAESGVANVYLSFNPDKNGGGQMLFYPMNHKGDTYSIKVPYQKGKTFDYQIVALDNAQNQAEWIPGIGYVMRGGYRSLVGLRPGMQGALKTPTYCQSGCPPTQNGVWSHDPVDTTGGNFLDQVKILALEGRPKIDFNLTYNSQGDRPSIFGENWTHSYNYQLIAMDNTDFTGAFVQYPDGKVVKFSGSDYTPEAGYYEKLQKTADGFTLTFKDLTQVKFDQDGDITRYEDANGNGLTFSYSTKNPYTLMSQLTSITADGGRNINFTYNDQGFVKQIASAEGRTTSFAYDDQNNLTAITDGRGLNTTFTYDNHYMTQKTSPKGHDYVANTYDDQGRVTHQTTGEHFTQDFVYGDHQTTITDAENHQTTYTFNSDNLLQKITDARGKTQSYTYTDTKEVHTFTDPENNMTQYSYDNNGNKILEIDADGAQISWIYNTIFNKPTLEVYKQDDHKTQWQYDSKGNLTDVTNAKSNTAHFTYNNFGQLTQAQDYNGHTTTYTYTDAGDVKTVTDGEGNVTAYVYDGLGRMVKMTTPRGFAYAYVYDGNDNLTQLSGPSNYTQRYTYDNNNHLATETDANNHTTTYAYDKSENLISTTNALGFTTKYVYGPLNEKLQEISPENQVTEYAYNEVYDQIKVTKAKGTSVEATTQYEYNGAHKVTKMTDPEGRVTTYTYDALYRPTVITANAILGLPSVDQNVTTKYTYTPSGAVQQVLDPNNNPTNYTLDPLDQVLTKTDAENQVTRYNYDAQGNLKQVTDPRSFTTTYSYDKADRLIAMIDAKGNSTTYSYDGDNNLITQQDPNNIITKYAYNELDRRITKINNAIDNASADAQTNVTTKYTYDAAGNLVAATNPRGFTTHFTFDAANRNTNITDANNNSAQFLYDKVNRVTQIMDRNQHTRSYAYDELDRLTQATDPENFTEKFAYDKVGNNTDYVNARGIEFKKTYDPLNRLRTAIDPYQKTKQYSYDATGNLLTLTDENGHTETYNYDKVYRLKQLTDAEGNTTQYAYDADSNLTKKIDGENNPTNYAYDELDRLIAKTDAENEQEHYNYDNTTHVTAKVQADGTVDQYTYDPLYRLATVVNNLRSDKAPSNDTNVTTKYTYDANGNLLKTSDPNKHDTTFAYDQLDRLQKETNPLGNQWTYSYDPEGNLVKRVDAKNIATNYTYYPDDKLHQVMYPTHTVEYSYNPTNFPTQMTDNLGTTTWEYDNLDRLVAQKDPLNRSLGYEYDFVGNLKKLNYPDGRSVSNAYLKNDWLAQTQNSDNDNVSYTRNKVGLPVKIARSNSSFSQITYDKVYRTTQVWDNQIGSGDHLIDRFTYTYNTVGDITKEVANYGWRQPSAVATTFTYDGLHRLTNATDDNGENNTYSYDAAGNRTQLIAQLKKGSETRAYSYNSANQLTQIDINSPMPPSVLTYKFQYDANGNRVDKLAHDTTGVDRGTNYGYDEENRLLIAQDYQLGGNNSSATPTPTPSVSPSPSPSVSPSPSPSPTPTTCTPGNGKNNGKDASADCNNGTGNDSKTSTASASATTTTKTASSSGTVAQTNPSPTPSPTPSTSPSPSPSTTPAATAGPSLAPENSVNPSPNNKARTEMAYDGNGRRLVATYYPGSSDAGKRTEYTFDRLDPVTESSMWNGQYQNLYRDSQQNLIMYQDFKSQQDPNGTEYWYHYDGRGNIAATTKFNAQSDHSYRYDEYGIILPEGSGASNWTGPHNNYTLTQKEFDPNTKLTYFGSRYYDADTGTWMTQDSYRGNSYNPGTLHRYAYNLNSPINYVDHYGFCSDPSLTAQGCGSWTPDWAFRAKQGISNTLHTLVSPIDQLVQIQVNQQVFGQPMTDAQRDDMLSQQAYSRQVQLEIKVKAKIAEAKQEQDCTNINWLENELSASETAKQLIGNAQARAMLQEQLDNQNIQRASQMYYYVPAVGAGYAFANAITGSNTLTGEHLTTQQRLGQVAIGVANYGVTVGSIYGAQQVGGYVVNQAVQSVTTQAVINSGTATGMLGLAGTACEETECAEDAAQVFNKIGSTGQVGENFLKTLGGLPQQPFVTSLGRRFVDQLIVSDGETIANESKVGYTALTQSVSLQIQKDALLLQTGQVSQYVWHFFQSPVTGEGGPSQPLIDALTQNNIQYIIH